MEFDRVPFSYLFFLVSSLLAFQAKSMSSFTNIHHNWHSSTTESLKFTNPASLKGHQSSPPHIFYDHAFQVLSTLHSQYQLEVSKKPPRFSFASNEKTFTLYTTHTPKFLSVNPSAGVWPESWSFKDNDMTGKVAIGDAFFNKGLATNTRNIKISMNYAMDSKGHHTTRARFAIYRVSWAEGRCLSYVLAAIYQNIVDGVDVILLFFTSCTCVEPSEMVLLLAEASFAAMEKGVSVRVSTPAGYEGRQGYETFCNGFRGLTPLFDGPLTGCVTRCS
jgi:hypothetical protein